MEPALLSERVAGAVAFGDHGSTYGGNLLACRAALIFLDALENGLLTRIKEAGARLEQGLRQLGEDSSGGRRHPWRRTDVGAWTSTMRSPTASSKTGLERGVIVNRTAGTVVRLLPPLTISDADIDEGLSRLSAALGDLR